MTKPELVEAAAASEVDGLYKLVSHWDALTNEQRFKLAWEALDKLGGRQPTPDDIEMARVIQLARDRGLAGIPSEPAIHFGPLGPVEADGRHQAADLLRRVVANAPPPPPPATAQCLVCKSSINVRLLSLRSSSGLFQDHHLCPRHLDEWILQAGATLGLMLKCEELERDGLNPVPKR